MAVIKVLYTTVASIRATIGVDENDLSDQMVVDQNLHLLMLERLDDILPTHEAAFDASETNERRLTLWCQFYGALQLIENTSLGIPQKIQANNDQLARYAVDFEQLKADLRKKLVGLENKLTEKTANTAITLMGVVQPTYNPVTG
jgi:hypothetical protein